MLVAVILGNLFSYEDTGSGKHHFESFLQAINSGNQPVNTRSSQILRKATTGPTLPTSGPVTAPGYLTHTASFHGANPYPSPGMCQSWKPPSLILNYARTQNCPPTGQHQPQDILSPGIPRPRNQPCQDLDLADQWPAANKARDQAYLLAHSQQF